MNPHDNDHTHDPDIDDATLRDALLTAYALGEAGPTEAAAAEKLVASDPVAALLVDDARATAALLSDGFAAEAPLALPDDARTAIAAAATTAARPAGRVRSIWPLVNAAAAMVAAVGLWAYLESQSPTQHEIAVATGTPRADAIEWGPSSNAIFGASTEVGGGSGGTVYIAGDDVRLSQPPGVPASGAVWVTEVNGTVPGGTATQGATTLESGSAGFGGRRVTAGAGGGYAWSDTSYQSFSGDNGGGGSRAGAVGENPGWSPYGQSARYDYSGAVRLRTQTYSATGAGGRIETLPDGTVYRWQFGAPLEREAGGGGGHAGVRASTTEEGFLRAGEPTTYPNTDVRYTASDMAGPAGSPGRVGATIVRDGVRNGGVGVNGAGGGGDRGVDRSVTFDDVFLGSLGERLDPQAVVAELERLVRVQRETAADATSVPRGDLVALETQLAVARGYVASGKVAEVMHDARVALVRHDMVPAQQAAQLRLHLRRLQDATVDLPAGLLADIDADGAVQVLQSWLADRENAAVAFERGQRLKESLRLRYGVPGEDYQHPGESTFRDPTDEPLSTFAIDVDTASYANVRRFLNSGSLPPADAVRVEELVNYFTYTDALPEGPHPIAATVETAACPWNTQSRLVRVGVKARELHGDVPPANLVFLVDVSGSMQPADKLPLLQHGLKMLTDQMREQDRIAIVTYASNSGVLLESTSGAEKDAIKAAIDGLSAGGSTNGGAGIQAAYDIAAKHFAEGGVNRVILATDGDFNVGMTDQDELWKMIGVKAESGVFLTVLGVGTGNLKDATMEQLADRGNGNYHYLDGLREARRVLVEDLTGTVVTVAKDVKLQIEFNPAVVGAYRLIGYENRMLAAADFNDDTKDAGEMGAGHTVTALYEVVLAGTSPQPGVDPLRYQKPQAELTATSGTGEMLTLKVRYKLPAAAESTRFEQTLTDAGKGYDEASENLRFASAVASFGLLLRGAPAAAGTSYDAVIELAQGAMTHDPGGRRAEFLDLALKAKTLSGR